MAPRKCAVEDCYKHTDEKSGQWCNTHRMRMRRFGSTDLPPKEPPAYYIRRLIALLRKLELAQRPPHEAPIGRCRFCDISIPYSFGRPRVLCDSDACKRIARKELKANAKANGRIGGRLMDRINKYGSYYERVPPSTVFKRDGFQCKRCLMELDPALRGTHHHRAPEIDHVIPLALGGPHTLDNLQVLCRSCNIDKGQKIL